MIEISCSNGDLSSTPSNLSEYFSVTSSLSILNSTEEVYHSLDEEIDLGNRCNPPESNYRKPEIHKIVKQKHLEIDPDDNGCVLSTSNETIPESLSSRNSAECEFWDKYLHPLRITRSEESISALEDVNNLTMLSNNQTKNCSLIEDYNKSLTDDEESVSISINNTVQLNTSQMDGDLSDINDVNCDSSISPLNHSNYVISEENNESFMESENSHLEQSNSKAPSSPCYDYPITLIEKDDEQIYIEHVLECESMPILELVKQIDSFQFENINDQENEYVVLGMESVLPNDIKIVKEQENVHKKLSLNIETQKQTIENLEDSPIKRSYLCCSIKRNKKKPESPTSKVNQKSKAKQIFSFLKKSTREKKQKPEIITEPIETYPCNNTNFVKTMNIDYEGIPFIDADVAIDSDTFISLATEELFSE